MSSDGRAARAWGEEKTATEATEATEEEKEGEEEEGEEEERRSKVCTLDHTSTDKWKSCWTLMYYR